MPSSLIGIDCRLAATHSGIGRYVRELVLELIKRDDPWNYVLFLPTNKPHGLEGTKSSRISHFPFPISHYSIREQIEFPHAITSSRIDLLHVPHFNIPLRCPVPVIATIHDLILHDYPNEASIMKRLAYRMLMGSAIRKSERIIAVSNATAHDITRHYGERAGKKITVIHNGIAKHFQPASVAEITRVRRQYHLPERFLLYVGAAKEHKNVQTLIDACPVDLPLVLVTGGKETARLCLRENDGMITTSDDADLPALYSTASVFVLPSFAEGFGLPILEAMACGCRVVASNRGSIPEIAGGFAILVEPTEEGLSDGIRKALEEPFNPAAAIVHARAFTWEGAAKETAMIYADTLTDIQ